MLLQIFKYNFFILILICCACTNENITTERDMAKPLDFSMQNNDLTAFHKNGYGNIHLGSVYNTSNLNRFLKN